MTCCNHNCNEGRDCPNRKPLDLGAAWRYVCGYVPLFLRYCDHAAAKRAGHLAAITQPKPQPQSGIWYVEEEPAIADVAGMLFRGLLALLAIATGFGALAFVAYTIAPLFAAVH
jgi:hypothetical protein